MKLLSRRSLSLAVGGWFSVVASAAIAASVSLTDDVGRHVAIDHPPRRIVTMLPSLTETVCELGECGRIVATDSYSNWPASVAGLPKLGGLDDASIEGIVALHPDLVIMSRSARTASRLEGLRVPYVVIETQRLSDIDRATEIIARVLGVPDRAAEVNRHRQQVMGEIVATAQRRHATFHPRVYFEVDSAPYAAGRASFIGELLAELGATNIVPPSLGAFPKLNPEFVVRENPDVIMTLPSGAEALADRPGWASIRALREHRVCAFAPADRDLISRPGPRIVLGLRLLADCLDRAAP